MKTNSKIRNMALMAIMGALAAVLMMFSFNMPGMPTFLKMDFGQIPELFAGFFIGPWAGVVVALIKNVLNIMFLGTGTAFAGEIMNFLGSSIFVLIAGYVYKLNRTKKGALIGLVVASVVGTLLWNALNEFIAFPMYANLYGLTMEQIVQMGSVVNPYIHDEMTLIWFGVFPFNIIKHAVLSAVTWIVYKRTANALRGILHMELEKEEALA